MERSGSWVRDWNDMGGHDGRPIGGMDNGALECGDGWFWIKYIERRD